MYPFWEVPHITSGLIIAMIASFHILPSHLATGAFWFMAYIEGKAINENRPELYGFLKRFSLFILVFCFVIGSLTGVGIWFSATVASPRGISGLIHNYVWGWATEWVFFLIEVFCVYAYYYTFGKVPPRTHRRIGLIYAWGAWISMVIITGILGFMLTSGKWIETGNFFDGFFNRTYWPQLAFRTSAMIGIASLYAMVVAASMEKGPVRYEVVRKAGIWGLCGLIGAAIFASWYLGTLPSAAKDLIFQDVIPMLKNLFYMAVGVGVIVSLYFLLFGIVRPQWACRSLGIVMMLVLLAGIGAGEGIREGCRRPYVINQYMFSHQVVARDLPAKGVKGEVELFQEQGLTSHLFFFPDRLRKFPEEHLVEAGRIIARHQCGNCHTMEPTGVRPIPVLLANLGMEDADGIADFLDGLGDYPFMPPFTGNEDEKRAVAAYLATLVPSEE